LKGYFGRNYIIPRYLVPLQTAGPEHNLVWSFWKFDRKYDFSFICIKCLSCLV